MTEISEGKFPIVNTHGYIKKITCSALDIYGGEWYWCFDVQGIRANHNSPFDINMYPIGKIVFLRVQFFVTLEKSPGTVGSQRVVSPSEKKKKHSADI